MRVEDTNCKGVKGAAKETTHMGNSRETKR
jgi:hypothetical protein